MGVHISTVLGRLRMTGFSAVAPSASSTAAQMSTAKSGSVPEKLSGEYSYRMLHAGSVIRLGQLTDELGALYRNLDNAVACPC